MNKQTVDVVSNLICGLTSDNNTPAVSNIIGIKIPILTNDALVDQFINDHQLQDPEKMIKFFVEAFFKAFEAVHESIGDIKELDIGNTISKVNSAKSSFQIGIDNPKFFEEKLNSAQEKLNDAIEELKTKIKIYAEKIRGIDNMSRFERMLKAHRLVTEITVYVKCARQAIDALIAAVNIQILIAERLDMNIKPLLKDFQVFANDYLFKNDILALMSNYDIKRKDDFWLKTRARIKAIESLPDKWDAYLDEVYETESIDFT
ncbi:MAG: hypothetical protein ACI4EA_08780 [Candidatus Ornithomonoglobus sp.]